ncbi:MAG: cytochrome c3 family protein [Acidobacteriia bacterium]|nr:cytochrome c3 family protein [Terriglobia bacterium]
MRLAIICALLATGLWAQKVHELCAPCHTTPAEDFLTHPHAAKGLSCDACHGKSTAHIQAAGGQPPDRVAGPSDQPALCGTCHSGHRTTYETSKHAKLVAARTRARAPACTTCHGAHAQRNPVSMTAQCRRCHEALPASCEVKPEKVTAKIVCANCHDPHTLALIKPRAP